MAVPALTLVVPEQIPLPFRSGSGRPSRELRRQLERAAKRRERATRLFNLAHEMMALQGQADALVRQRRALTPADVLRVRTLLLEVRRLTRMYCEAAAEREEE